MLKCPGQDPRFWKPDAIRDAECPACGEKVEFFKDDLMRRCRNCGHRFRNPFLDLGCAEWCKFAEQCIPLLARAGGAEDAEGPLKDQLLSAMREKAGLSPERMKRALSMLDEIEQLLPQSDADARIVVAAALLRFLSNNAEECARKARDIMAENGFDDADIEGVCELIRPLRDGNENASIEAELLRKAMERVDSRQQNNG